MVQRMRLMHVYLVTLIALLAGAPEWAAASTAAQRLKLAEHAIGLNMAFHEAQRAGKQPADSVALFPNIWKWKKPGFENICSGLVSSLTPEQRAATNFPSNAGYYEAGNAVLVTGPSAFVATQQAIGALQFMSLLATMTPGAALGDTAGCLKGGFTTSTLKDLLLRQIRYFASSLSAALLITTADGSDFKMLVGVADSSTYGRVAYTSWDSPAAYQEKCYVADMTHPAADVAAQAAAGLAMTAKVLETHGDAADAANAERYGAEAARAYAYAELMYARHGADSTCTRSAAVNNCIGSGCTTLEENGSPVRSTCVLYPNNKPPEEHLFVAAAALYALTEDAAYRADADAMWPQGPQSVEQQTYLYNWNNVLTQGIVILSTAPDQPGAQRPRTFYQSFLRASVELWTQCSNDGASVINNYTFCERTPDGSAYPLDFPWGNLGTTMNGLCAAGMYQTLGYDPVSSPLRKDSACFMQRQLGYIFNHKCSTAGSSCNTKRSEGFSYMVGIGRHYPTKLHSRDASFPYFYDNSKRDPGRLCGALVSGPYANTAAMDGPVRTGTDLYENNRLRWQASEAAIDYTASLVCTLMAYATMPDSLFAECPARSPFTGRKLAR